jgi:hypothetical protein
MVPSINKGMKIKFKIKLVIPFVGEIVIEIEKP